MSNDFDNTAFNSPDFGLPEGYFQKSASSVLNKIEWLEEHKDLPALSGLKNQHGFTVPENYFSKKEQKLELLDYRFLSSLKKENVFQIPGNYFEEAEILELSKVIGDVENTLDFIPKQNNFKTTAGYFSRSEKQISKALLTNPQSSRVISLFSTKTWMAAAAVLIVALGFWTYNFYFSTAAVKDCGTMACIDKADLLKSKNLENIETDELYELVNTKQLEQKLEKKSTGTQSTKKTDSLNGDADDYLLDEI